MKSALDQVVLNNTVMDYLIAIGIILVGLAVLFIVKSVLIKKLHRWSGSTQSPIDDVIVRSIERFGVAALQFAVIYWGVSYLTLGPGADNAIHIVTSVVVTYFLLRLVSTVIMILLHNRIRMQDEGENKIKQLGGLMLLINIVIWTTGIVFLLENLQYPVNTIITGLGIGGIAIALAAQNILGDLFNYFVIFFDRPFEAGDFITVDDKSGTVEYVGIKTTRIRSISGEQIVIGNSNLTGSRIHNYKRMVNRRVLFTLNIDYRTPPEKLQPAAKTIQRIIEGQPRTMFERAHFATFGDWSLKFEVVYYVLDPDHKVYLDIQQQINIQIYQALHDQGVYFVTAGHLTMAPADESKN